jgi:DNA-directed RNA polymerase subunit K/omega
MPLHSDEPTDDIIGDENIEDEEDDDVVMNDDDDDDNDDDIEDDNVEDDVVEDDVVEDDVVEDDNVEDDNVEDDNVEDDDDINKVINDINMNDNDLIRNIYNTDDEEDDDDLDEDYLQKIDEDLQKDIIIEHHHELKKHNMAEIETLCKIVRNTNGIIIDPLHKTVPFVTRYEEARIIGERAQQLESGSKPFIEVKPDIIDSYLIALDEYKQKKIPFIVRRPLPNGGSEYWRLADLEQIR